MHFLKEWFTVNNKKTTDINPDIIFYRNKRKSYSMIMENNIYKNFHIDDNFQL